MNLFTFLKPDGNIKILAFLGTIHLFRPYRKWSVENPSHNEPAAIVENANVPNKSLDVSETSKHSGTAPNT